MLDRALPVPLALPEAGLGLWATGGGLILLGMAIFAAAVRNFSRAATPVPSTRPVRTLVTTGIHGFSRNPIYVGMFLLYAGIGVAARSAWVFVLAVPLAVTMRYGVVAREEAYLELRFGDAYREYKARVRRWL
jgi:protein-S-isoprenylcysteine O-methyltransferase Ste14